VQGAVLGPVPGDARQAPALLSAPGDERLEGRGGGGSGGTPPQPVQQGGVPGLGHGSQVRGRGGSK
jgi:hypothetical protein